MANRTEKVTVDVNVKGDKDLDKLARSADSAKEEIADLGKSMVPYVRGTEDAARATRKLATETDRLARSERARRQARGPGGRFASGGAGGGGGARIETGGISLPLDSTTLAVGGVAATALAPLLGATAGGAILAGGGIAAAGLGVAGAAANNQAIGRAAQAALQAESQRWQQASRAFEEPTLRAIARIKKAVDNVPLEEILKEAAEFVDPLAAGVGGFIENFGDGFGDLVADAKPVIDVLKVEVPRLGRALGEMFREIGEGSEGGAEALEDILHVVSRIIIGTGKVIHFFEDAYAAGVKLRTALPGDVWSDDEVKVTGSGQAIAGAMGDAASATADASEELETYEDILHRLIDLPLDLREANREYEAALDDLSESIKENKRDWRDSTDAGRANNEALDAAVKKAIQVRDAQLAMGVQSGVANRQLEAQIAKLRAQAIAAGMSAAEFDRLTGSLRNFIAAPADKTVNIRIVETTSAATGGRGASRGRLPFLASGGDFEPGYAVVGEEGPELVKFNGPGRVYSNSESKAMARTLGASPGGGTLAASMTFGGDTSSWLAQAVMGGIRTGQIVLRVGGQRVTV